MSRSMCLLIRSGFLVRGYIITAAGIVIRMDVDQLRKLGRNTQGVNVITLREDDTVTSIAAVKSEEEIVKE